MINQQLLTYISSQQEAGVDDDTIKENLLSAGWRQEDVDEGFQAVADKAGGGNSPQAHQDIRKEASEQRTGQEAVADEVSDDSDGSDNTGDSYREPIAEEDEQGPASASDDTGLSPIDETAGSSSTANSRQQPEEGEVDVDNEANEGDAESVDLDTDDSESDDAAESDTVMEETGPDTAKGMSDDGQIAKNPLDSHEEMKKIGQEESSDHDPNPVAMRTFARDSEQVGKQKKGAEKIDSPDTGVAKAKQYEQKKSLSKNSREDKLDSAAMASLAKEVEENNAPDDSSAEADRQTLDQESTQQPQKQRPQMSTVNDIKSGGRDTDRSAEGGKRRFTAAQKSAAMKKEAARRKKSSSSGSNWVSILIFIFVLILVGGGGAYAYITYFQNTAPETSASEVMTALTEAGSFDFRVMVESAASQGMPERNLVIEGAVDLNTDNDVQSYYTITSGDASIQSLMAEVESMPSVPAIQRDTIRDILLTPEFLSVGTYQTEERLGQDGVISANRFGISVDSEMIVSDYATLHQALLGNALSQEVLDNLQTFVAGFEPTQGQAWLDPESNVPYQITVLGTGSAGQDMQVNIQMKNHGGSLEQNPSYEPRSIERSLEILFAPDDVEEEDEDAAEGQDEPDDQPDGEEVSTNDSEDEETATSTDNDESDDETSGYTVIEMQRFDRMRINDLQQLRIALRMFQRDAGMYPSSLSQLLSAQSVAMNQLPRDPVSDSTYRYSVSDEGDQYHLGSTLQILGRSDASGDANFNSASQGFSDGFDGAGQTCVESPEITQSSTCYDLTGSVE